MAYLHLLVSPLGVVSEESGQEREKRGYQEFRICYLRSEIVGELRLGCNPFEIAGIWPLFMFSLTSLLLYMWYMR